MCTCVHPTGEGGGLSRFRTLLCDEACSRFKGVAGVFHTGTTPTFGREVNWKSMGASVDLSGPDPGRWAIGDALAGKHASRERSFGLSTSGPNVWSIIHAPFHHEGKKKDMIFR